MTDDLKEQIDISKENSRKLDQVLQILRGEPNLPGLMQKVQDHEEILMGTHGDMGVTQRVALIWKTYIWILCTASALISGAVVYLFKK